MNKNYILASRKHLWVHQELGTQTESFHKARIWTILRITGDLDFVYNPAFFKQGNRRFWKLDLFPSSGGRGKTPNLLGALERANLNHWTQIQ
jgi:hypothetical protein